MRIGVLIEISEKL